MFALVQGLRRRSAIVAVVAARDRLERARVRAVISEDFAFYGFDQTSWNRLVDLFREEDRPGADGVLVVVVDRNRAPVASFHTARGSLDPDTLPPLMDLEALCEKTSAGACILMRERAIADLVDYLAEPLDPDQDFVTRVMRFAHVLRELGNGNWLRVWPNPLPHLLIAAAPAAKPAIDFFLPDGMSVVLGVFDEGDLWTGAVLRRKSGSLDVLAGPESISRWAGPLGGAWRRDHRVLVRAVERELGPIHVGLFMERATARALFTGAEAGEWAMAYATREMILHPLPAYAAAGLGVDVFGGAAKYVLQALDGIDGEELVSIAQGFWRGLTDGKGLEGLFGFSPGQALTDALSQRTSRPPPSQEEAAPLPSDDDETTQLN